METQCLLSTRFSYQAVEAAVLHILQLTQGKESLFCGNGKSLAVKLWRQFRELLVACGAQSGPTKCKASIEALEVPEDKGSH